MNDNEPQSSDRTRGCLIWCLLLPVFYLLSSGPVLGLAFWLRETTGWDGFYMVMWLYYPIYILGHDNLLMSYLGSYIEWWVVDVFHTVGPG